MFKKILCFIGIIAIFGFLTACGSDESPKASPANVSQTQVAEIETSTPDPTLVGTWTFGDGNVKFIAEITNEDIEILMQAGESKGLYWAGTFQSSADDGEEIVSKADKKALSKSLFGSTAQTKSFKYDDGKLVYEFKMMGVTRPVELVKS